MNRSRLFLAAVLLVIASACDDEKEIQPQPTITSLSVTEGEIGTVLTITGTNFGTTASDVKVFFEATEAEVSNITATQITTAVPAGVTPGVAEVKVKVKALETTTLEFAVLAPITVSASNFTTTIEENPAANAMLGGVQATTNRGTLTYSITSQNINGALAINASTGQLSVANASVFDFEALSNFGSSLGATVSVANGTETATANVTIMLADAEEVVLDNLTFTIDENPETGAVIGNVSCCWTGASPVFGMTGTPPGFGVNGSGQFVVTNARVFDYETNSTLSGVYIVTSQSEQKAATITITLADVDETPEAVIPTTYNEFAGSSTGGCDDGSGDNTRFTSPYFGYAHVPDGFPWSLYVSDLACGVRKIDVAADGSQTSTTIFANSNSRDWEYTDMVYSADASYLLMVYRGTGNGNGNVLSVTLVENGNNGSLINNFSSFSLSSPEGIARDGNGNIYVTETRTIRKFSVGTFGLGTLLATYGDAGNASSTDGTLATATFTRIRDVQVNAEGVIYVADLHSVRKVDEAANTVSTVASGFDDIRAIGLLPNGNIIVADHGNSKIRRIDVSTGEVSTLIQDLADSPPTGIIVKSNEEFYFTRYGQPKLYKAIIDEGGCNVCR